MRTDRTKDLIMRHQEEKQFLNKNKKKYLFISVLSYWCGELPQSNCAVLVGRGERSSLQKIPNDLLFLSVPFDEVKQEKTQIFDPQEYEVLAISTINTH